MVSALRAEQKNGKVSNIFQIELPQFLADRRHQTVAQFILRRLSQRRVVAIARLDTKISSFFDQRDPTR